MPRKRTISDEELLAAARTAFVELGIGCSTKEIARRAGISEALLFQRFRTKAELFFAAMVAGPEPHLAQRFAESAADLPSFQLLGQHLLTYFRGVVPVLVPLLAHPDFRFEEFAMQHPDSALVMMRRECMAYFQRVGSMDPPAAALLLISSTFGVAMFERLGAHGGVMPPDFVYRMLEGVWRGAAIVESKWR